MVFDTAVNEKDMYFYFMTFLSFLMSFAIGSNETDALATAYSSGALTLMQSLIMGSFFEFVGAFWCSKQVSTTLSEKIIMDLPTFPNNDQKAMMFAVTISAFSFIMLSTGLGMPISGTHTIVGSLIGAGLVGVGSQNVNTAQIIQIVVQWVASPLSSALLSCFFMWVMCSFILNEKKHKFGFRLQFLSTVAGLSFTFICILVFSLISDDMSLLFHGVNWLSLIGTFIIGMGTSRFLVVHNRMDGLHSTWDIVLQCYLTPWRSEFVQNIINEKLEEALLMNEKRRLIPNPAINDDGDEHFGLKLYEDYLTISQDHEENHHTRNDQAISLIFKYLMVMTSFQFCVANGALGVANSISPLLNIYKLYSVETSFCYMLGSVGMALGLLLAGKHVLETIGKKVIILDFPKGFCVQFAASNAIMICSYIGIPVSATHCNVGSLIGITLASKLATVKDVYHENKVKEEHKINKGLMIKIFLWWMATLPIVFLTTSLLTYALI